MITISEMIGFPVSKKHGEELMNRLSIYNKMTKKELMVLLLQYDWELLQLRENTQGKITLEVFRTKLSAEEMKIAAQKFHDAVEKMNDTFKKKVSCRFCKFYENNCPLSVGYAEKNNGLLFCYPNRICDDFEFREEL